MKLRIQTALAITLLSTVLGKAQSQKDYYSNNFDVLLKLYKVKPLHLSKIYQEFSRLRIPTGKEQGNINSRSNNNTGVKYNNVNEDSADTDEADTIKELIDKVQKSPQSYIQSYKKGNTHNKNISTTTGKGFLYSPDVKAENFNNIKVEPASWIFQMSETKMNNAFFNEQRTPKPIALTFSTIATLSSNDERYLAVAKYDLNNFYNVNPESNHLDAKASDERIHPETQSFPEAESL